MTPRTYEPLTDQPREWEPGGAWGRGGGTLPLFLSADAITWLLTADEEGHGDAQMMRETSADPIVLRPMLARWSDVFPHGTAQDPEASEDERAAYQVHRKAVFHELHASGLIGEHGYWQHYRTPSGDVIARRLRERATPYVGVT